MGTSTGTVATTPTTTPTTYNASYASLAQVKPELFQDYGANYGVNQPYGTLAREYGLPSDQELAGEEVGLKEVKSKGGAGGGFTLNVPTTDIFLPEAARLRALVRAGFNKGNL